MRLSRLAAPGLAVYLLAGPPAAAQPAPTGTIRFDNVSREIDWCEEVGETIRYRVQGVVYEMPRKGVEVIGLTCHKIPNVDLTRPTTPLGLYFRHVRDRLRRGWAVPSDVARRYEQPSILRLAAMDNCSASQL